MARPHQRALYDSFGHGKQFQRGAAVWHRRAGKDSCALNLTARDMFKRVGTYWHLFPEQTQARRAIWNGIDRQGRRIIDQFLPPEVRKRTNAQEMLIETVNGSMWQMAGSDNYDSLVGSNPIGVVFSEWSIANPEAWEYIRPILVENDGWALFIYTPRGRNHGYSTFMRALEADNWFSQSLSVEDTGLVTVQQIEDERQAGMSDAKVRQEFYCSFEAESDDQLIKFGLVQEAMQRDCKPESFDEKVIGVDVARFGDDKSCIYFRHGRDGNPMPFERHAGMDTMQLAARVADWIRRWGPDAVFVDDGGVGGGVVDRLHQLGFHDVRGVNFGGKSDYQRTGERAANKRAEMWLSARAWMERGGLPDDQLLAAELSAPMYKYDANNAIILERKEDMKKRGVPSPDIADAFALTFAYPVMPQADTWEAEEQDHGRNDATGY
ncbi:hypothetical protein [Loktanella sp. R86503]|uniref:hypothetical protein n=1 Tax=Loktanella sp. R86503 TaxID=3093847 RepID=UPI0036DC30FF